MQIAIIGTGYVGLVTGAGFAELGHTVRCMDIDSRKIRELSQGKIPIYEPGLQILVEKNLKENRLYFTDSLQEAVEDVDFVFLTLPTPPTRDGRADISVVLNVVREIAMILRKSTIIVTKSTVPVGTTEQIQEILNQNKRVRSIILESVSNPEFLREGRAVEDFLRPERIVVGVSSQWAKDQLERLYHPFIRQGVPFLVMDIRSAELTKYAANAYLATRISFINEIARLCEALDADVMKVRMGIGLDSRIGLHYLYPSLGFGGSCLPKDIQALIATARENGEKALLIEAVHEVNQRQRDRFTERILWYYDMNISGKKLAIWGLSFKQNTDDIRESPALSVLDRLIAEGAQVSVYDPAAMERVRAIYGDRLQYAPTMYDALTDAEGLVVCTEWRQFRSPDFRQMRQRMKHPVIFDGRNLYDPEVVREAGFSYISIGRKPILQGEG